MKCASVFRLRSNCILMNSSSLRLVQYYMIMTKITKTRDANRCYVFIELYTGIYCEYLISFFFWLGHRFRFEKNLLARDEKSDTHKKEKINQMISKPRNDSDFCLIRIYVWWVEGNAIWILSFIEKHTLYLLYLYSSIFI